MMLRKVRRGAPRCLLLHAYAGGSTKGGCLLLLLLRMPCRDAAGLGALLADRRVVFGAGEAAAAAAVPGHMDRLLQHASIIDVHPKQLCWCASL